ncbi:MAG TPA: hypothetical protein VFE30_15185 [Anaeromyxobacteraceae bacterium]|jgi:long-subunit fatty acid transport protein|nr:hypothetical protein [Anaeromyxobacteraceae bacterium]
MGRSFAAPPRIRPAGGRRLALAALLLVPCAALAQSLAVPVPTPKNIILPNYDNVLIGQVQAVEAGAYLARVDDASAGFYNPAGLAAATQTAITASASGFVWSRLSSRALGQATSSSRIESSPGSFAIVIGEPFIKGERLRLGFSITNAVSSSPSAIDEAIQVPPAQERITFSSRVGFSTVMPALSLGYKLTDTVRLGLGGGLSRTSYSDEETFSGLAPISGRSVQFVSVLRASGEIQHLALSAGVQWDVAPQLTLAAVVRAPGLRLSSGSLVTYESASQGSGLATSAYFRDDGGAFEYKLPLELSAGAACRLGAVQAEVDVRYHASAGQYTFYRSARPLQVTTQAPDGSTSQSVQPFAALTYSSRAVTNVALGASYHAGPALAFHAGFFASFSPIGNAALTPFQQADLYGATAGAALTGEHWSGSLGLAYELGSSTAVQSSEGAGQATSLEYRSATLLYAVGYKF